MQMNRDAIWNVNKIAHAGYTDEGTKIHKKNVSYRRIKKIENTIKT